MVHEGLMSVVFCSFMVERRKHILYNCTILVYYNNPQSIEDEKKAVHSWGMRFRLEELLFRS